MSLWKWKAGIALFTIIAMAGCGGGNETSTGTGTASTGAESQGSKEPVRVDEEKTDPPFRAQDVPVDTDVTVTFTKGVTPLTTDDFVLERLTDGARVSGSIEMLTEETARFHPAGSLDPETDYRITIFATVTALDGAPFDQVPETPDVLDNYSSVFTTGAPPCLTAEPTVTAIEPNEGPLAGGQRVVITGSNFTDAQDTTVTFGEKAAQIENIASATIELLTPPGDAPGLVDVTVRTCGGESVVTGGYRYLEPPVILSVTDDTGPVEGAQVVTIMGANFTTVEDTTVLFGENAVNPNDINIRSSTEMAVLTPPAEYPGAVDVTVINSHGTGVLEKGYFYTLRISPLVGKIVVNEVVTDPVFKWNDTGSGDGIPFNSIPGTTTPNSSDEWIELENVGDETIDLTGWSLQMIDLSPITQFFEQNPDSDTVFRFSQDGSISAFGAGEFLVVGNPDDSMDNSVWILLRDAEGRLVDEVEIGDVSVKPPTGDGAPDGEQDGASQDISNEAIARFPDAIDSDPNEEGIEGADIADFTKRSATIGVSNNSGAGEPGSVVINEVVTDPQADWSDSIGGRGEPFDARPGTGVPQQDDQWIELFNVSDREIDLTGWTLLIHDSLPSKELLSDLNDHLYFTEGSSARKLLPGGYLVIGNPDGVMEDAVFLELRDAAGQVIDTVEIGADFEGDGLEDGAPDGENNGNASNPVNEAIARFPNGTDSDIGETGTPLDADVTDFIKRSATILTSNDEGVVTPGDVVINEVVTDPQSDWDGSSVTGCRPKEEIPFDWIPCTGQGARVNRNDQYIELFSKAAFPLKITGWSVVMKNGTTGSQVDTEYLNLVGTDLIEPVLRFSSPDDARTNTLSPGQFLVIGNPEGVMDDTVFIELRDGLGTVIDNVELGDNPEGDDPNDGIPRGGTASGTGTEAVQRTPNGTDSDPNEEGIRNADIDDFTKRGGTPARVNAAGVFPEIGDVVINEVVTDPQTNWSETNFDGTPSPGAAIQGEDEFIEFFIKKSGLDLTGWTVEVNNDIREIGAVSFEGVLDPNDTVNRAFQVMQYFGRGSFQDTAAGDYVVVGDPALEGSIGNNCFILLREPGRTIIDDVEIGDDPENDGEGDGAPQGQPGGGDANSPQNEAVARVPNGGDTDNDVADFRKQPVTLGASNERRP